MKKKILLSVLTCVIFSVASHAQAQFAISTNIGDWAFLGTMNVSGAVGFAQHFSVDATAKYNPWSFYRKSNDRLLRNKQVTLSAGARYWPWTVFTEWYFGLGFQYQQYNRAGLWGKEITEGDAYGMRFEFGYAYMFNKHWNMMFGLGGWLGGEKRTKYYDLYDYQDIKYGEVEEPLEPGHGIPVKKFFILPSEVNISIVYIF